MAQCSPTWVETWSAVRHYDTHAPNGVYVAIQLGNVSTRENIVENALL